jgi:acetyl-CoA carboxylase biotin carboxylase subunit
VQIGPASAKGSYLNAAAVLEAALSTGVDAIHPGYGFLSEDADFAEACADNDITFIGPPADVLARLGDKCAARELMAKAGVPMLPGSLTPVVTEADAVTMAAEVGYPVIIKAVAGGGGRGMQVVHAPADLAGAYGRTRATAQTLFGDSRVYIERYLESSRHVEVQIVADRHGTVVHLGERDCSVQRRHQKLIEETPSPRLGRAAAEELWAAAVRGAREAGYVGAGTFEFLVGDDDRFYFMEVNPRIQVEHPVTEAVTGIDLVAEQLRIASGERLSFGQDDVRRTGVAIECRVNAEDPDRDFAPTPGTIVDFVPSGGPFVRVDTHGHAGYRIPPSYDSLLAKVVVWAPDRDTALARMRRALGEFTVTGPGIATTAEFLRAVLAYPDFQKAEHNTSLVDRITQGGRQGRGDLR